MTRRHRPPKPGERLKVGGKLVEVPRVPSMTGATANAESPASPPEKPEDELPDELKRAVKAAYQ